MLQTTLNPCLHGVKNIAQDFLKVYYKLFGPCLVTHLDCSLFGLNVREKSLWVVINLLKLVRSGRKLVMKFSQYYQNAKKNIYV